MLTLLFFWYELLFSCYPFSSY